MSVNELQIAFDSGDLERDVHKRKQFYIPGEQLRGVVTLHLNSGMRIRSLLIRIEGEANVSWEVPNEKKTYSDMETYLEMTQSLVDAGQDKTISLPKGRHQFAFDFDLPTNIPSTFLGVYGSVIYVAKTKVEAEDELNSTVTTEPFMVLRRDQLPEEAYYEKYMKKSRFFLGFTSGRISADCTVHQCIAVPGETIDVSAEVKNWSGRNITLLQGAVILESKYHAQDRHLVFRQFLSKREDSFDVDDKWGRRWKEVKIQIPPYLADSGLATCKLIDIQYLFQFRVQIAGKEDMVLEAPLFVGCHSESDDRDPKRMLMNRMMNGRGSNAFIAPNNNNNNSSNQPFGVTGPAKMPWYGGKALARADNQYATFADPLYA